MKLVAPLFVSLTFLVNKAITKDALYNKNEYNIDNVMRFSTVECWQNETVKPKTQGTIRIAVVGDATTMGVGSNRSTLNFDYDNHL